jgi:hypothetical protein
MTIRPLNQSLVCSAVLALCSVAASASGLRVSSATFVGNPQRIVVDLVNDTHKPITAYMVEVTVTSRGAVVSNFGFGEDDLDSVVSGRVSGAADSWAGAILPMATFEKTLPEKIPNIEPADAKVTVEVKAVLYSDGSADGDPATIQLWRKGRETSASVDGKIVSILVDHAEDKDIKQRVSAITQAIDALKNPGCSQIKDANGNASGTNCSDPRRFQAEQANLHIFQESPNPKAALDAYTKYRVKAQKIRLALIQSATD